MAVTMRSLLSPGRTDAGDHVRARER